MLSYKKYVLFCFCLVACFFKNEAIGQKDSTWQQKPQLGIAAFLDVFYFYDFNKPQGVERQEFLFNHNRHNEFNLNLGLIKVFIDHDKYRANLALQTGTYAMDNYANEPVLYRNIFEANVGISLNKKNSLWLDAGVLPSYIGFESAISSDNWTMTRSILAENSPYFVTGAKLTYTPNDRWELAGLLMNGWQRIQRVSGGSIPALGSQINFQLSERTNLNWSTFIGTDDPDSLRRMRYFNNFYGVFQLSEKFGLITGFDFGFQQKMKGSAQYDFWMSTVLIAQMKINETWCTAIRGEYYQDAKGVIIPVFTSNGFQTVGISWNLDYVPSEFLTARLEARWFNGRDAIFQQSSGLTYNNFFLGFSLAVQVEKMM